MWPASVSATRVGYARKNVRLVHQKEDRIVGSDLRQRAGQVVDAAKAAVAEPIGELIADPSKPKSLPRAAEHHRFVFQDGNLRRRRARSDADEIVPPIVIAEDRPNSERSFEPRQFGRPDRIGDPLIRKAVGRDVVAEQNDKIGAQQIGGIDDLPNVRQRHVRSAGVKVGDHRDGQLAARRPARRIERIAGHDETLRLDAAGVYAGRRC